MNYKDLPFEERMQKAMEYALILVSDERPGLDVINELKDVFGFTENEAKECYIQMRKKFDEPFEAAIKTKIRLAWTSLIGSTIILAFFAFISTEMGWFYFIYTFIWGTVLIGVVPFLARHYREKAMPLGAGYLSDRQRTQRLKLEKDGNDWTTGLPLTLFILAMITFYLFYTKNETLDAKDLYKKYGLIVADQVRRNDIGSKSSHYEMVFRFEKFSNKFEFDEKYYKYAKQKIASSDFSIGDTIAVEISMRDAISLQEGSDKDIAMTNLSFGESDDWLIDHEYRNKTIGQKNKNYFLLSAGGFVFCLIIVFFYIRYRKGKLEQTNFVQVGKIYRSGVE